MRYEHPSRVLQFGDLVGGRSVTLPFKSNGLRLTLPKEENLVTVLTGYP